MIIIQDTREQIPLIFSFYSECEKTVKRKLDLGDYSIDGFEDKVFIERKRTTSELSINLGKDSERFYKELDKAKNIKWKFIVCEFNINKLLEFPKNSGIPIEHWSDLKFNGKALYKLVSEIESKYNIKFVFCEDAEEAAQEVINIFNKVIDFYKVPF